MNLVQLLSKTVAYWMLVGLLGSLCSLEAQAQLYPDNYVQSIIRFSSNEYVISCSDGKKIVFDLDTGKGRTLNPETPLPESTETGMGPKNSYVQDVAKSLCGFKGVKQQPPKTIPENRKE